MEVFLHNLPPQLTDQSLKIQLGRFIDALNIRDWSCQKPRKKHFGFLTFLHVKDGELFLHYHRQPPNWHPGSKKAPYQPLSILGRDVSCSASKKSPEPFLLKSLEKAADDRRQAEMHASEPPEVKVEFAAQVLSCGFYDYINGKLSYCPQVTWTIDGTARFTKRVLILNYHTQREKKRVEIPYRIIEALVVSSLPPTLTLTLWEPPRFYHVENPEIADMLAVMSLSTGGNKVATPPRYRLTELPDGLSSHKAILGQALVYQISVSPENFDMMTRRLKKIELIGIYHTSVHIPPANKRKSLSAGMKALNDYILRNTRYIRFEVLFQMEALVKNGFLLPWTVKGLLEKLVTICRKNLIASSSAKYPISANAVKKLFSKIQFPSDEVDASCFSVEEIWKTLLANEENIRKGLGEELISVKGQRNLTMIHKINVTPTTITLQGPDPESKNRILRRFADYTQYFIRVQFCDEDGSDLQFNSKVSNDSIYERFTHIFNEGIQVGGRVYKFLGFSHSSLRSHSAWFMATFWDDKEKKMQSYFTVIAQLGQFDDIRSPARRAARIGQAFSETPNAIPLESNGIRHFTISDIASPDGSRTFSDGVGICSTEVVEAIHAAMGQRRAFPTCFQIRWGGAKGMLSLNTSMPGPSIAFRPSMVKFKSDDTENLEICDTANKPIPLVLNRQMIKILEDMGLPDDWFLLQQARALYALQLITAHISNTANFLLRQRIAEKIGLSQLIRRLDVLGIDFRGDRFLCSVVEAAVLRDLRLLKHKARIPINQGVTLFGIVDEFRYLEEGEVYVTFSEAPFVDGRSIDLDNRRMLITRSPALHPGDIQIATNVVPPDHHPLRDLTNCIVFSSRGTRDLPSCLSGGDLDGDIYNIIWDKDAVQGCKRTFEPADYPRTAPLDIGRDVEPKDMTDFFIKFMATDKLGLIATRHMILADQRPAGTDDSDCKILAEMHSTSVDYSKTGIPADMGKLRSMKGDRYRPDFLAPAALANIKDRAEISFEAPVAITDEDDEESVGPRFQYYYSDKILGQLFRGIDEKKIWYEDIHISVTRTRNIWGDLTKYILTQSEMYFGKLPWQNSINEAWEIRELYEDEIFNTTQEYSDHASMGITELEVFTGSIFNKTGVQTRRQRDKSIQLKDEFDRIAQFITSLIRKSSVADTEPCDGLTLSIACLAVGNMLTPSTVVARGRAEDDYKSFKVIAACCAIRELDKEIRNSERDAGDYLFE